MIPTILTFVKENKTFSDSFGIFEIGHTVCGLRADGLCNEVNKLGAALYSKVKSEEELFMQCRDIISELVSDILHRTASYEAVECEYDFMHPANTFAIKVGDKKIGTLSVPHPTVLSNIDKKCAVAFFEIETEAFAKVTVGKIKYKEPSKFPGMDIDLTFNADLGAVNLNELTAMAKNIAPDNLTALKVKDIYTKDGASSLTLRFSFSSNERTLTKAEVQAWIDAILAAYKENAGIEMKL